MVRGLAHVIDPRKVVINRFIGIVLPVLLIIFGVGVGFTYKVISSPYRPGAWLGSVSDLPALFFVSIMAGCLLSAPLVAISRGQRLFGIALLFTYSGAIFWSANSRPRDGDKPRESEVVPATRRFQEEVALYKKAISTKTHFGDQFTENNSGRTVTYWRWAQTGIDNAVGVVYDPSDEFPELEDDGRIFKAQTFGIVVRAERMEPHWFIVWHG